jgi:hypothetical protein
VTHYDDLTAGQSCFVRLDKIKNMFLSYQLHNVLEVGDFMPNNTNIDVRDTRPAHPNSSRKLTTRTSSNKGPSCTQKSKQEVLNGTDNHRSRVRSIHIVYFKEFKEKKS